MQTYAQKKKNVRTYKTLYSTIQMTCFNIKSYVIAVVIEDPTIYHPHICVPFTQTSSSQNIWTHILFYLCIYIYKQNVFVHICVNELLVIFIYICGMHSSLNVISVCLFQNSRGMFVFTKIEIIHEIFFWSWQHHPYDAVVQHFNIFYLFFFCFSFELPQNFHFSLLLFIITTFLWII